MDTVDSPVHIVPLAKAARDFDLPLPGMDAATPPRTSGELLECLERKGNAGFAAMIDGRPAGYMLYETLADKYYILALRIARHAQDRHYTHVRIDCAPEVTGRNIASGTLEEHLIGLLTDRLSPEPGCLPAIECPVYTQDRRMLGILRNRGFKACATKAEDIVVMRYAITV